MARTAWRACLATILSGAIVAATPAFVSGHESADGVPDVAALEAACRNNTDSAEDELVCLDVVHRFLAPASAPQAQDPEGFLLGDSQPRGSALVTVAEMHWSPRNVRVTSGPGHTLVAVLVRYEALEEGIAYDTDDWLAIAEDGVSFDAQEDYVPVLGVGELSPGEETQGWVTFEIPRTTQLQEIVESRSDGEDLRWSLPQ